jgi:HlyD family secretion protein
MAMIKINCLGAGLVLAGLVAYGAGFTAQQTRAGRPLQGPSLNAAEQLSRDDQDVQGAAIRSSQPAASDGGLNGSRDGKIVSNVNGTVIWIRPPLSIVKKGEVICELDSALFQDTLTNQKITVESAKMIYVSAELEKENAELALVEYQEGSYKLQLQEMDGDIKLAEAELALAEHELTYTKKLVDRKTVSENELKRPEVAVLRARIVLERAQVRQKLLRDFTHPRKIKGLKSKVEKYRSIELAKKLIWVHEQSKEKKLEQQIAACSIRAPRDGILYYAQGVSEHAVVHERQLLFTILPEGEQ